MFFRLFSNPPHVTKTLNNHHLPPHITKNTFAKKVHQKHTEHQGNTPSPKNLHMQQQDNITRSNREKTYTYGTIIGCSPHPSTCVCVGWVFCLGLCRSNGVFLATIIICFVSSVM